MGRKHLTDNEKGQILGMHRVGTRVVEIAKMLKCHRTTIGRYVARSNPIWRTRIQKLEVVLLSSLQGLVESYGVIVL